MNESIADVEPGATFSRTYIYNCRRKLLNPSAYTFSFDCVYSISDREINQKHLSASVSAVINPKPVALNLLAILSSVLGAILKLTLDRIPNKDPIHNGSDPILNFSIGMVSVPSYDSMLAAMITALFFYNVYDSTEIGKKISVGTGWRSALIIGGLSGLLNQRVLAALQGLLG